MPRVKLSQLAVGMRLSEDVYDDKGILLISKDRELTYWHIELLIKNHIYEVSVKDFRASGSSLSFEKSITKFRGIYENVMLGRLPIINEVEEIYESIIKDLESDDALFDLFMMVESFDSTIYEHSVMVSMLSALISKWLGYSEADIKKIAFAGLFHDIGKSNVPKELLDYKGPLTDSQKAVVRLHPLFGYTLLKDFFADEPEILSAIRDHHEKTNGTGYPSGKTDISEFTAIISVANIFSGKTISNYHRVQLHPLEVLTLLKREPLNRRVVDTFVNKSLPRFLGYRLKLNNKKCAEILQLNFEKPDRPVVRCDKQILDLSKDMSIDIIYS